MSCLVARRPARRAPRTVMPRHTPRGDLHFVGKIDNLLQRGHLVMVSRCGCGFVSVALNGPLFLVRDVLDEPIGSFGTLSEAIAALDAYDEDDQKYDDPRGGRMSATVIPMPQRGNLVMVRPCKAGFEIVLSPRTGDRRQLGTRADFAEARVFAQNEAFKVGRCRVQILSTGGRP